MNTPTFDTYSDWHQAITERCGLTLDRAYCESRIEALSDESDHATRAFLEAYCAFKGSVPLCSCPFVLGTVCFQRVCPFVLGTGLFDIDRAEKHEGWLDSLVEHTPETEEYGITNFIYERRLPFHPQRFYDCLRKAWPGVIRSKGVFWLATRLKMAGFWSQAGAVARHECAGQFWAAIPRKYWPEDHSHIDRVWDGSNGVCRQEIVLIGRDMDREALTAMLDECLLTEDELATNEKKWHKIFPDPFPKWRTGTLGF